MNAIEEVTWLQELRDQGVPALSFKQLAGLTESELRIMNDMMIELRNRREGSDVTLLEEFIDNIQAELEVKEAENTPVAKWNA